MAGADDYATTVNRYLELLANGSADDVTALYAEDATIEDPIGSEVRRGRAAIREFYAAFESALKQTELVSLRVGGNEAAFLWSLTITAGDSGTVIEPISVMTFDNDARITTMRAFWSPADVKPV